MFWKWKSQAGRPRLPENMRKLIVQIGTRKSDLGDKRVAAELSASPRQRSRYTVGDLEFRPRPNSCSKITVPCCEARMNAVTAIRSESDHHQMTNRRLNGISGPFHNHLPRWQYLAQSIPAKRSEVR
jgi:hypothetical protein